MGNGDFPKEMTPQYSSNIGQVLPNSGTKPTSLPPINLKIAAEEAEYEAIVQVLKKVKYNKSRAAEELGIDRKTLYNKLKKYGIE